MWLLCYKQLKPYGQCNIQRYWNKVSGTKTEETNCAHSNPCLYCTREMFLFNRKLPTKQKHKSDLCFPCEADCGSPQARVNTSVHVHAQTPTRTHKHAHIYPDPSALKSLSVSCKHPLKAKVVCVYSFTSKRNKTKPNKIFSRGNKMKG